MNFQKILRIASNNSFIGAKSKLDGLPKIAIDPNEYTILEDPKIFHQRLLDLIKHAKQRICFSALYLQNDEAGNEILQALYDVKKDKPNLHIRVYVDYHRALRGLHGKGPQIGNNVWYHQMAQKQLQHPIIYGVPVKRREVFGVLHLKGFVIDNTILYSGASINNVYLNFADKYRLDRYHEIVSDHLADAICNYCTQAFHQTGATFDLSQNNLPNIKELAPKIKEQRLLLVDATYHFANESIQDNQIGITPLVGLGKRKNQLNATILNLINAANKKIVIFTPYFGFPLTLLRHVNNALKRGIDITLVIGDKEANDFYIKPSEPFNKAGGIPYIYEMNLRKFVLAHQKYIDKNQLHIHLWHDKDNTYHVKGITVDHDYALITGNNLNPRAWGLDLENGLLIHDPHHLLLEKLTHERDYLLTHTKQITSATQIQQLEDYPQEVRSLITFVRNTGMRWLIRKIL